MPEGEPIDGGVVDAAAPARRRPPRVRIDGREFPDKVLALTWDDGPDAHTIELARYLHDRRVSATFFVVGAWIPAVSEEPGEGEHVFETGYDFLDVLGTVSSLGHRIANHTRNHVVLTGTSAPAAVHQLADNQKHIEAYGRGDLRFFRTPGGAWDDALAAAVDGDPSTADLVGPVHWDIDGKDWESSLYCSSDHRPEDCERAAPGGRSRVKVAATARQYVALATKLGHGIVLFHDRVGHVGSDYALRLARIVVPALEEQGFVFGPVGLRFASPEPAPRALPPRDAAAPEALDLASIFGGDVDRATLQLGDVDGDGRADLCARVAHGISCALAAGAGWAHAASWSASSDLDGRSSLLLGDINGDGRADVCANNERGLVCALSNGRSFLGATLWLAASSDEPRWPSSDGSLRLVDINRDGRSDVCGDGPKGPVCALAP